MPHKLSFRVVNVSSEEEHYPAVELNHHSPATKGWISSRFCTYPQRIVLALDQRARLRKIQVLCHQYLIASKIEFFVGDMHDDSTNHYQNARYGRLGYVSLSDNESTEFKARELKSVHVDASGCYVQLALHKNHPNLYNLYNQIGIVAVNLIGDVIRKSGDTDSEEVSNTIQRPEFISPTEDLAFDIYQDPEVANIIRRLEKQKLTAVTQERFDQAQKIRDAVGYLQRVGERLGRMELEKKQAVEEENYERAKLKKFQISELRTKLYDDLDLVNLLSEVPVQPNEPVESVDHCNERSSNQSPYLEERPLPALTHHSRNNNAALEVDTDEPILSSLTQRDSDSRVRSNAYTPPQPLARNTVKSEELRDIDVVQQNWAQKAAEEVPFEFVVGELPDAQNVPEQLSETHLRQASVAVDVVGIPLVTQAYSKSWVFRYRALLELRKRVSAPKLSPPASAPDSFDPDPRAELRSTTFLLRRALQDQVLSIFRLAADCIKGSVVDFADCHSIPRAELSYALDKLAPVLFHRTGDTSPRVREVSKSQILQMAQWPQLRQNASFWNEVVRPFSPITLERLAVSRLEIVTELYTSRGVDPAVAMEHTHTSQVGFTLDAVATFTAKALNHRSNEIRESAENFMVTLYEAENRATIRGALPPDDVATRRHPLYRRLFAKFDRIDEASAPVDVEHSGGGSVGPDPVKKRKELAALQVDIKNVRSMVGQERNRSNVAARRTQRILPHQLGQKSDLRSHPIGRSENVAQVVRSPQTKLTFKKQKSQEPVIAVPQQSANLVTEAELLLNLDKTCIFCGEQNEAFTEEGLDVHYWKDCPMLHRCGNCKQVVEIAGMVEHLLSECEATPPGHYVRCDRCCEAVRKSHLPMHRCAPSNSGGLRCPLCHTDLPLFTSCPGAPSAPEDVWKAHLLGVDQNNMPTCTNNPRRPVMPQLAVHVGSRAHHSPLQPSDRIEQKTNGESRAMIKPAHKGRTGIPRPIHPTRVRPV